MGDVFSTDEQQTVQLTVNGQAKGAVPATGNLGQFLRTYAQQNGVRTFSAYADGNKLDTSDADDAVSDYTSIEIVAKDSRG